MYRTNRRNLNTGWRFNFKGEASQPVHLPHTWNALDTMNTDPHMHYRRGVGLYELDFNPPEDFAGQMLWLEFESVAQKAAVYFDEECLTEHSGGYTRFCVPLPNQPGLLRVEADNTPDPNVIPSDMSDFFLYGGITRNVWLYATSTTWIETLRCDTHIEPEQGRISLSLVLGGDAAPAAQVHVAVRGVGFSMIAREVAQSEMQSQMEITLTGDDYRLWSPDIPNLYEIILTIRDQNRVVLDSVKLRTGLRDFDFPAGGPFYLNGERLLLRGTHRHEDWAGYGCAVPDEITYKEFALMKDAGFNFVRTGHYPQSRAALEACDELGLIVWEELPWCRGGIGDDEFKRTARHMLKEMVEQHHHHPAIVFWGLGNELDWESEHPDSNDEEVAVFLQELHDLSHQLDPTRLTALRRFEPGADIVDVYSPSIWAGWYRGKYEDYETNLRAAMAKYDRMLHMEWGGDSHVGRFREPPHITQMVHSTVDNAEEIGMATSKEGFSRYSKDGDWSESYIVDLMAHHLHVQSQLPDFAGGAQWAFKDFGTPLRPENPIPYVNQKGIIARDGTPKSAYYVFKAFQTGDPVTHIESTPELVTTLPTIRVITNQQSAELAANGVVIAPQTVKSYNRDQVRIISYAWSHTPQLTLSTHTAQTESHQVAVSIIQNGQQKAASVVTSVIHEAVESRLKMQLVDVNGYPVTTDERRVRFTMLSGGEIHCHQGVMGGSQLIETANGLAWVTLVPFDDTPMKLLITTDGIGEIELIVQSIVG